MTPRASARAIKIGTEGSLLPCSYIAMVLVLRPRVQASFAWLNPCMRRNCAIRSPMVFLHLFPVFYKIAQDTRKKCRSYAHGWNCTKRSCIKVYGHLCMKQRWPCFMLPLNCLSRLRHRTMQISLRLFIRT